MTLAEVPVLPAYLRLLKHAQNCPVCRASCDCATATQLSREWKAQRCDGKQARGEQ